MENNHCKSYYLLNVYILKGIVLSSFNLWIYLLLTKSPWAGFCYSSHFTDEETEEREG